MMRKQRNMKYKRKVPTVEAFQLNRDAEINAPGWFARAVKKEMIYFDRWSNLHIWMHDQHRMWKAESKDR